MSKILIAAPVCHEYRERWQACLDTWAGTNLCDVKLYTSEDFNVPPEQNRCMTDQTGLVTRPGQDLSYRLRELCRWALEQGYTNLFKCDDDTYVWVDRLLASSGPEFDYLGFSHGSWHYPPFASGGAGFWLSRKSMQVIAESELDPNRIDDVWIGERLLHAGIILIHDPRYSPVLPAVIASNHITVHYIKDPEIMRQLHNGVTTFEAKVKA